MPSWVNKRLRWSEDLAATHWWRSSASSGWSFEWLPEQRVTIQVRGWSPRCGQVGRDVVRGTRRESSLKNHSKSLKFENAKFSQTKNCLHWIGHLITSLQPKITNLPLPQTKQKIMIYLITCALLGRIFNVVTDYLRSWLESCDSGAGREFRASSNFPNSDRLRWIYWINGGRRGWRNGSRRSKTDFVLGPDGSWNKSESVWSRVHRSRNYNRTCNGPRWNWSWKSDRAAGHRGRERDSDRIWDRRSDRIDRVADNGWRQADRQASIWQNRCCNKKFNFIIFPIQGAILN